METLYFSQHNRLIAMSTEHIMSSFLYRTEQSKAKVREQNKKNKKCSVHTAASIRWSSPTQLLISRSEAYLWLSGREAEFSTVYGRM